MLKQYIKNHGLKISELSKSSGIAYSTVNDIVNGKTSIYSVSFGTVKKLAQALNLALEEIEKLCLPEIIMQDDDYSIIVKNKSYYIISNNEESLLFKVNGLNSQYLEFAVECYLMDRKIKQQEQVVNEKWADFITSCEKTSQ